MKAYFSLLAILLAMLMVSLLLLASLLSILVGLIGALLTALRDPSLQQAELLLKNAAFMAGGGILYWALVEVKALPWLLESLRIQNQRLIKR
jgi:hypothetical protein